MKKFTLLMSALMLATGAFAQVPEGKFIIAASASDARGHGKYMAVTAEGRLITTNTIDSNALWEGAYTDDYEQAIANVGVTGFLYEGTESRNITLSATPKAVAVMESLVVPGAYGITTNFDADPADQVYINFLNALNTNTDSENGGIGLWTLDKGSSFFLLAYDPEETEEQISAKVDELVNLATAKANAKASVEGYLNASWAGRNMGESAMWNIDYAETQEEIDEATHTAMQSAITFAERSLENGSILYNIRANQVITYTGNETTPIERTAAASIQSLWVAEPVDGDPIEVDGYSFKSFYLRNAASGKYIGKGNGNTPVLAVDTKEEAGTMNLVMGVWNNNGNNVKSFELIINNNGQENQYLNVSTNPDDPKLTIYNHENDGGAFFKFNQLPTFESDLIPSIIGVGETDNGEFRSLEAIEVCVPVGATLTGIGSVLLTQKAWTEDYSQLLTDTIAQWSSEDLAKITPAVKTVDVTWAFETQSVEAQVYTLPLSEPITAVGAYQASVSAYAFSNTIDEETKYYNSFNKTFDISEPKVPEAIVVTPAAGKVESISVIAIDPDSEGGWSVGQSTGEITVTYNGEITTDANGNELSLNGDAMWGYDAFDWDTWTGGGWEIPVNFSTDGKYVLTIPAGFFENYAGSPNEETIVEWTIGDMSGIKEITSLKINGKAYDLNGRAVANPTRGLFIINGQKVIK